MKKLHSARWFAYTLVMVLPLWFGSCKKGGGDVVTPSTVEGNWKISAMKVNPAVDTGIFGKVDDFYKLFVDLGAEACLKELTLTFNSNGTTSANNPKSCQASGGQIEDVTPVNGAGKWVMNGSKLSITDSDGTTTTYDTTSSGNTMTLVAQQQMQDATGKPVNATMTIVLTRA